VYCE
jgi:hypothetical protein